MLGVVGFPRCGSSLVMQMLAAGGYPCVGEWPAFEEFNPLADGWSQLPEFSGKAVKLLDNMLSAEPPSFRMNSILLRRDPSEQAKSLCKFLRVVSDGAIQPSDVDMERIGKSFVDDYPKLLALCAARGNVLRCEFESLIAGSETNRISAFVGGLDDDAMARCIERRGPGCLNEMLEIRQLGSRRI